MSRCVARRLLLIWVTTHITGAASILRISWSQIGVGANRSDPARQTVLTFYGGNTASVEDQPNERIKLLTTPFSSYKDSLRSDMNRMLAGRNFDFDRDVTAVYLYRWGHSMVYPKPGWPFSAPIVGSNGKVTRVPSAR